MVRDPAGRLNPPGEPPRSPSRRVPQWALDEAAGRPPQHAVAWRVAPAHSHARLAPVPVRRSWLSRLVLTINAAVVVVVAVTGALWVSGTGQLSLTPATTPVGIAAETPESSNSPSPVAPTSNAPERDREPADELLPTPRSKASAHSSYRFARLQKDGKSAVAYAPCRRIHYVIRQAGSPRGGREAIAHAVRRISSTTGLQFVYDGPTDEPPAEQRAFRQPERYGDGWAPVLIAWVTPEENPALAGDVAGQAGSAALTSHGRPTVYVTGTVQLDAPQLKEIMTRPDGARSARAIIMHELGHLVGLDHVDDKAQLMYPQGQPGVTDFGAGDLAGLTVLGRGACVRA